MHGPNALLIVMVDAGAWDSLAVVGIRLVLVIIAASQNISDCRKSA